MLSETTQHLVREAVGIFDNAQSLQAAADELMSSGFDRACLSLVAGHQAVEEKLGHMYEKVDNLEDDPAVPRKAFASIESLGDAEGAVVGTLIYIPAVCATGALVASGGALAGIVVAAALAGSSGGLFGLAIADWIDTHHADYLQEQLDRGGLLLWVRTWNTAMEERATEILSRHSARDVHVHGLPSS